MAEAWMVAAKEAARIAEHEAIIKEIEGGRIVTDSLGAEMIEYQIAALQDRFKRDWQEFAGRAKFAKLAPREQAARSLEFRIAKLRHGLGMPPDPDALAHYERLLG